MVDWADGSNSLEFFDNLLNAFYDIASQTPVLPSDPVASVFATDSSTSHLHGFWRSHSYLLHWLFVHKDDFRANIGERPRYRLCDVDVLLPAAAYAINRHSIRYYSDGWTTLHAFDDDEKLDVAFLSFSSVYFHLS